MIYALDTNAVIGLLSRQPTLLQKMRAYKPGDFGISAIVAHELFWGAYKSQRAAQNVAMLDDLRIEVIAFDTADARHAGEIRAALAKAGTPIGPFDLLIAGQARARDLTLITNNAREFSRVDGLRVEDWQAS